MGINAVKTDLEVVFLPGIFGPFFELRLGLEDHLLQNLLGSTGPA